MKELYETIGKCFLELAKLCEDAPKAEKPKSRKKAESKAAEKPAEVLEEKPAISFTEIRSYLAELSRAGKTAEIRQLILSYGKEKLSDIEPSSYSDLMQKAKELEDAR